jgi:son of sevenless-like protein
MRAAGDVHEMYDKSLLVEPREREEEKIARLLAESGFL